jgi:hypothetical protein
LQNELVIKWDTRTPSGEDTLAVASTAFSADVPTGLATILAALAADENVDSDSIVLGQNVGGEGPAFS